MPAIYGVAALSLWATHASATRYRSWNDTFAHDTSPLVTIAVRGSNELSTFIPSTFEVEAGSRLRFEFVDTFFPLYEWAAEQLCDFAPNCSPAPIKHDIVSSGGRMFTDVLISEARTYVISSSRSTCANGSIAIHGKPNPGSPGASGCGRASIYHPTGGSYGSTGYWPTATAIGTGTGTGMAWLSSTASATGFSFTPKQSGISPPINNSGSPASFSWWLVCTILLVSFCLFLF